VSVEIKARSGPTDVLESQVDEVIAKLRASRFSTLGFLVSRARSDHQCHSYPFTPHAITTKGFALGL